MGEADGTSPARPSWARRLLRALGLVAAATAALLVFLYATRAALLLPWLGARVTAELQARTGASISLGELSGNLFTELELRDLRLEDLRPEASMVRVEVGWARARYDLWGLLRGDLAALTEVEASRVQLELRAGEGTASEPSVPEPWTAPAHLPSVRLRDVALHFDHELGALRLAGADLDLASGADGAHTLAIAASQAAGTLADGRSGRAALRASLALTGSRLELARLELDGVERARGTWVELSRHAFGELAFGGTLALPSGELVHAGELRAGALALDLTPQDLQLGPILDFALPEFDLPDARLDGRLRVELDTARPQDLRLAWNGRMQELRWAGREFQRLDAEVLYEAGLLSIARLEAGSAGDLIQASDVRVPLGLGALATLRQARGALRLETRDLPALLRGVPKTEELEEFGERVPVHRIELALRLEPGLLQIEQGSISLPDGSLLLRPGSLRWGEEGLEDAVVDVDLEFDFRDLAALARLVGAPRVWSGALAGRLDLKGSVESPAGALSLSGSEVVAAGLALGQVTARADVDRERLRCEAFESRGAAGTIMARGVWEFADATLADVELALDVPDLAPFSAGQLSAGSLALRARLAGAPGDPRGSVEIDARGLVGPLFAGRNVGALAVRGRLEPGRAFVERCLLEVEGVALEAAGTLEHTRFAPPLKLELEQLTARRGELDLALAAPARLDLESGFLAVPDLHLVGSAGDLRLSLALDGDDLDAELVGQRLDPMPLLAPFVAPGFELRGASCDLLLRRRGADLALEGGFTVARLRPAADLPEFSLSARGSVAEGRATLEYLRVDSIEGSRISLAGQAPLIWGASDPLAPGPLSIQGSVDLSQLDRLTWERFGLGLPLAGDLGLDIDLGGDWSTLSGSLALRGERLAILSPRTRTELFGPARLKGRIEFDGSGVRLKGLEFRAPDQASIQAEISLACAMKPRAWWAGEDGGLGDGALAGWLRLDAADLAVAARYSAGLRRLDGVVTGEVALAGTPRAPQLEGVLEVRDGELRLAGDVPGLMGLNARLEFTHERLRVAALHGEIGGGPLDGSGEIVWSSGEPQFDLRLAGSEVLLVQRPELRLRSDVDLTVRGPLSALAVEGRLDLRDGRWSKRIDFYRPDRDVRAPPPSELELFSFAEPPLSDLRLNVEIRSAQPFIVANNLVKGELLCDLRLGGTGRTPDLLGSLFVGTTRVSLPASSLTSQSGTIRFDRDDPLVPRLDVRFTTRTRGYDVLLRLGGTSIDPEVELSSAPPLSDEDLLLLVLTGKVPDSPWGDDGSQGAAENVAFFIGKDILKGWFGGESEGESVFDRIDWRTGVDVSHTGAKTTQFTFRLQGPQSGPGRTVLLSAEEDIYDHTNFGLRVVLRGD